MYNTTTDSASATEKSNKIQQGSEREGGNDKEGDFLMLVMEIVDALIRKGFDSDEKSIILYLAKKTIGQQSKLRQLSIDDFMKDTGISRRHIFRVLKDLTARGVLLKHRRPGERTPHYALSVEYFGRTNSGQIKNVYYSDKFKVSSEAPLKCQHGHIKGAQLRTENSSKPALIANSAKPSYISSDLFSYLSGEMRNFLITRSRNTQKRWNEIVKNIPQEDHNIFLAAVQISTSTNIDFLGNPIRSSVLCLFESTPWKTIREVFLTTLKIQKEEDEKKKRREENERLVAESRRRLHEEVEARAGNVKFIQ